MAFDDNARHGRSGYSEEIPGEGWAVVIHDDDFHEMREVACALKRVAGLSCDVAREIVWKACDKGWAVVTIATREEADAIVAALRSEQVSAALLPC